MAIAFNVGVFRRRPGRGWEQFEAPQGLERSLPNVITADSSGRTWLGYQRGDLVLVVGDSVRVFGAEQGLDVGRVLTDNAVDAVVTRTRPQQEVMVPDAGAVKDDR